MSKNIKHKRRKIEITSGSLWRNIFFFSIPLMLSNILEILFNLSDVAIVGKYSGYIALGAVGSTTQLVILFTGFLIGMGSGVNVRIAHKLGTGNDKSTQDTLHTSALICLITGLILCFICIVFAGPMLHLLNTKSELMNQATLYLKIYALGMPASALYNFGNGVLSASGETKRPLIYLSISGVLNVLLNLLFVIVFGMAAEGVAIASVIAQYLSAVLIICHLLKRTDNLKLKFSQLAFHEEAVKSVLMIGIPSGLQFSIFAIANLFVQTGVNTFDAVTVSGISASMNADSLINNIMGAFYTACATFISTNYGAKNTERMKKSYRISIFYSAMAGALFGCFLLVFGPEFLRLFTTEPEVINAGMERIKIIAFGYAISAFMDCTIAAARGIGKSISPTIIEIIGSCIFRIIWIYTVFAYFKTIVSLFLLYIFSWTITAVAEIIYFKISFKKITFTQSEIG